MSGVWTYGGAVLGLAVVVAVTMLLVVIAIYVGSYLIPVLAIAAVCVAVHRGEFNWELLVQIGVTTGVAWFHTLIYRQVLDRN